MALPPCLNDLKAVHSKADITSFKKAASADQVAYPTSDQRGFGASSTCLTARANNTETHLTESRRVCTCSVLRPFCAHTPQIQCKRHARRQRQIWPCLRTASFDDFSNSSISMSWLRSHSRNTCSDSAQVKQVHVPVDA